MRIFKKQIALITLAIVLVMPATANAHSPFMNEEKTVGGYRIALTASTHATKAITEEPVNFSFKLRSLAGDSVKFDSAYIRVAKKDNDRTIASATVLGETSTARLTAALPTAGAYGVEVVFIQDEVGDQPAKDLADTSFDVDVSATETSTTSATASSASTNTSTILVIAAIFLGLGVGYVVISKLRRHNSL